MAELSELTSLVVLPLLAELLVMVSHQEVRDQVVEMVPQQLCLLVT